MENGPEFSFFIHHITSHHTATSSTPLAESTDQLASSSQDASSKRKPLRTTSFHANTSFRYKPLDPTKRQIRIVEIWNGSWNSEMFCTIRTVSMNDEPVYNALSYVWGDPNDTVTILLNGEPFEVTRNLWHALRRLRHKQDRRSFWIDAICINQDDDEEKSHQVASMGHIFESCSQAFLFLGECLSCADSDADEPPYSDTAAKAFDMVRILASNKHLDELACFRKISGSQLAVVRDYESHFAALHELCSRPWWSRIWVVQEAALPEKACFMWAHEECTAETVYSAGVNTDLHWKGCCNSFGKDLPPKLLNTLAFMCSVGRPICLLREQVRRSSARTLHQLRSICLALNATNQRDLVYGLLGLVNDWGPAGPFPPDYSGSMEQYFAKIFLRFSEEDLSQALLGRRTVYAAENLPSWLPNWMITSLGPNAAEEHDAKAKVVKQFKCSRDSTCKPRLIDDLVLVVEGVRLQRLEEVGVPCNLELSYTSFHNFIREWMQMVGIEVFPNSLNEDPKAETFWRTVIEDWVFDAFSGSEGVRRADSSHYDGFQIKHDAEFRNGVSTNRANSWYSNLCTWRKAMLITGKGNFGMAYEGAAPKDEVYVILGCSLPLLLRRNDRVVRVDETSDPIPSFTVIGDCYLHGFMDGEGLSRSWEDRVETIALV